MAKALKTFTTSAGFFDLAVAAPSMKAALQAWGASMNLFKQGFAKISTEPNIVAATMARPGVVLKRPVGSQGAYSEDAALPASLPTTGKPKRARRTVEARPPAATTKPSREEPPVRKSTDAAKADRLAAQAFEKEQRRREHAQRKEDQARKMEHERRKRAIAAAQAAMDKASRDHDSHVDEIEKARAALDQRLDEEMNRWRQKKERLEKALREARSLKLV